MKESMEDRIIERYLNGQMRPEEEREFRALLELDPDLRRRMDAETIVQRALEHDRAEIQHEESGSYARFLAALATSVPAAEGALLQSAGGSSASTASAGSSAAGLATGSTGALSGGLIPALMASGVAKGIIGVVAAVTMATGVYVATPKSGEPEQASPAAVAPASRGSESSPMMIDSSATVSSPARPDAVAAPTVTNREESAAADSKEPSGSDNTTMPQPEVSSHEGTIPGTPPRDAATREQQKENDLDAMLKNMEKDAARQVDVIESDSVATAVKIGTKGGATKDSKETKER
jgi:hypothetical protein